MDSFPHSSPNDTNYGNAATFGDSFANFSTDGTQHQPASTSRDFGVKGIPIGTQADLNFSPMPSYSPGPSFAPVDLVFDAGFFPSDAFDQTPSFPSQPDTVWDKSPLTASEFPKMPTKKLFLVPKLAFSRQFLGSPVSNPLSGNVIFGSLNKNGAFIVEVSPSRDHAQVACVPVLSDEVRRQVVKNYQVTAHSVETIWTVTTGLYESNGKKAVHVAALVDLLVLESSMEVRVIILWRWGAGASQSVEYVLTPPAGADVVYDHSTFQIADSLLFLAGSSPKGACVFVANPADKMSWLANYLEGRGNVTAMAVNSATKRIYPYLVIALADLSVTVWTYRSAAKNRGSQRCLFPLCRLEYATVLSAVEPTALGTDGDASGIGEFAQVDCSMLRLLIRPTQD